MIHKPIGSSRGILTFPAVHPCESISPVILLKSLIDLARDICSYKSKFFATNKRNVRQTFLQIGNLLVFLEEIRKGSSGLPDSIVLSLSELHLTFQKLQYLLEDCTRDGARLWMLTKSDRVSNQFRVLIRSIATSLDVFPFGLVNLSSEVNELVELVMRQARKARIEVDPDDKRAINDVTRILGQFEEGVAPDPSEIKRVLDHLGIRKRSACNKEVKFLDAEIATEYLNVEKRRELGLLSSLMGFMCYCRCVFFGSVDDEANENHQQCNKSKINIEIIHGLNPDDFRCPISLEIMTDPVTLSTGHTYDRSSILKWFRGGNPICPNTGEKLTSTELFPNLVIKRLIQQYCADNGAVSVAGPGNHHHKNSEIKRTVVAGSSAAEGAMKMLAVFIVDRLVNGEAQEINKAAFEVRVLTKRSIFNRSCLVEAGIVPNLLNLLLTTTDSTSQENAIAALLNLSKHSKGKSIIVEIGGLDLIVGVLNKGLKIESRQHAAGTLFYLASVEEYSKLIGEIPEAIPGLIDLIKGQNDRAKKNALIAILGLLMHDGNRWRVLAAGTVPLLIDQLKYADKEYLITDSLAVLATLAEKPDGSIAILLRGALKLAVEIFLDSSTSRAGKEYCVSLLLALCVNGGGDVVAFLVKSPSLMGSLYSLLSEGTSRASKKASALIRILHQFCERSSSSSPITPVSRERFVHVW